MMEYIQFGVMVCSLSMMALQTVYLVRQKRFMRDTIEAKRSEERKLASEREEAQRGREICSMELSRHEVSVAIRDYAISKQGDGLEFDTAIVNMKFTTSLTYDGATIQFFRRRSVMKGKLELVKG